ncbi:hypothetical protein [Pseudidiomarina sp.]|uniref:hypothetical protein n=1 Tax=Pseudidiomarina sp. TaxID=2081707 RepID=UPI00299EDA48|nr:hypothetical protein [Pseudidiomarina sp.]MDX1705911.1 hypothetical protein [Pseudidiomarina sp.]
MQATTTPLVLDKLTTASIITGTAMWMSWSVLVVLLSAAVPELRVSQLFGLLALSGVAATLAHLLLFAFGDKAMQASFAQAATVLLLIPALGLIWLLQDNSVSYSNLLLLAFICGLGGAQFMALGDTQQHDRSQLGWSLGVNASVLGIGIILAQVSVPVLTAMPWAGELSGQPWTTQAATGNMLGNIAAGTPMWLANVGWFMALALLVIIVLRLVPLWPSPAPVYVPHPPRAIARQLIFRNKHTWLMALLYVMAFGSFIGFAITFPLSLQFLFGLSRVWEGGELIRVVSNDHAPNALTYAWIGPLLGVLARPLGGWVSDQTGGARLAQWCALALAAACSIAALVAYQAFYSRTPEVWFLSYILAFLLIFIASGMASSAIFKAISEIFPPEQLGTVLRWVVALATTGAIYIPLLWSLHSATATPAFALLGFAVFYVICAVIIQWVYLRRRSEFYNP